MYPKPCSIYLRGTIVFVGSKRGAGKIVIHASCCSGLRAEELNFEGIECIYLYITPIIMENQMEKKMKIKLKLGF